MQKGVESKQRSNGKQDCACCHAEGGRNCSHSGHRHRRTRDKNEARAGTDDANGKDGKDRYQGESCFHSE